MTEIILIIAPMLFGSFAYVIKKKQAVRFAIVSAIAVLIVGTALLIAGYVMGRMPDLPQGVDWDKFVELAEIGLSLYVLYLAFRLKNVWIGFLAILQAVPLFYFEHRLVQKVEGFGLFLDNLSITMLIIVAAIGSLIMIFAIKYMEDDEKHKNVVISRQPRFFAVIMIFLGAMNGLVMANNIIWLYMFWEITTLCSFLLISHDGTDQAMESGVRALIINMIGGVAFAWGIITVYQAAGSLYIQDIIKGPVSASFMFGIAFLAIAAFTKTAQFPFQSWLLGAMVAPTPVSALLHSSTMVKAGVYLLIRLAPAFSGTAISNVIGLYGALSFVLASLLAISQSNAKRILAYSTVANLGLIIASVGINTPMAIAAAILLVIFHAVSKGLLFLSVGTIEHEIGSRDIENMRGLFYKMPYTTMITVLGIITMLLAPFGVLLSKWMVLEAASQHPFIALLMAVGSALTVVYYTNWVGILLNKNGTAVLSMESQSWLIRLPLTALALAAVALIPDIGTLIGRLVEPEVTLYYHDGSVNVTGGMITSPVGSFSIYPVLILIGFAVLLALVSLSRGKNDSRPYACGLSFDGQQQVWYEGQQIQMNAYKTSGYYFADLIKERKLTLMADILCLAIIAVMLGMVAL